jgi:hypothetical protein
MGRLACDPAATLIAVDLPAPFEPTIVVMSRGGNSMPIRRTTATSP